VNKEKENKKNNTLNWRDYLLLAGFIIVFYFYKDFHEGILNYPDYLRYSAWVVLFVVIVALRIKRFAASYAAMPAMSERLFYAALSLAGVFIVTVMATGILLSPFNYYNRHIAAQSPADTVRCNIDEAYIGHATADGREPNTIKYHFMGQPDSLLTPTETPLIANMHAMHTYAHFKLVLATHKALLGSYWLQSWSIEEQRDSLAPEIKPHK